MVKERASGRHHGHHHHHHHPVATELWWERSHPLTNKQVEVNRNRSSRSPPADWLLTMGLTFWAGSHGVDRARGTQKSSVHGERSREDLVNAVQRARKPRPEGPICRCGRTPECTRSILNTCDWFLLTRERRGSQGRRAKVQIIREE